MKATFIRSAVSLSLALALGLVVGGCKDESDDAVPPTTQAPQVPSAPPAVVQSSPPPTPMMPEPVGGPANSRVKAEVDERGPDGGGGAAMVIAEGKTVITAPSGWTAAKAGAFQTSTSADQKARIAAAGLGANDSAATKAGEAATALTLTDCVWGAAETFTVGKDKLPGSGADGTCKRGGADVKAAYVAISGANNIIAVGAWDAAGGDAAPVFSSFRSIAKVAGGGDSGVGTCCAALQQNMNSAPPEQKFAYAAAIATCNQLRSSPEGRQALAAVRAALAGANVPTACR